MSYYGVVLDLPVDDVTIREGDVDPIIFTLQNADGTPVNLSGKTVKFSFRPLRGAQVTASFTTDGDPARLAIVTPTAGTVRLTPLGTTFLASAERYHGYFSVLTIGVNPQTVPQDRELWLGILPAL